MNSQEGNERRKVTTMYRAILSIFLIFAGAVLAVQAKDWIDVIEIFNQSQGISLGLILMWGCVVFTALIAEVVFNPANMEGRRTPIFDREHHRKTRTSLWGSFIWVMLLSRLNPFGVATKIENSITRPLFAEFWSLMWLIFAIGGGVGICIIVQEFYICPRIYKDGKALRVCNWLVLIMFAISGFVIEDLEQWSSILWFQHLVVMMVIAIGTTGIVKIFQWKA